MVRHTFETPVVLIVFNRPQQTRQVFEAIAQARPPQLFVVADGPRPNRPGEAERCREVRNICLQGGWPGELHTIFADENMGCRQRVISGLDRVFSQVEEAIILEDDCLPDPSFFPYCQELLERYRGDSRIGMISGTNLVENRLKTDCSYIFCHLGSNWGWATWRAAWRRYDYLANWPEVKRAGLLYEVFDEPRTARWWSQIFDDLYQNTGINHWDYQWFYTSVVNHALSIVPVTNMITNIGFGPDATHTSGPGCWEWYRRSGPIDFPLKHPAAVIPLRSIDTEIQRSVFQPGIAGRALWKFRRIKRRLARRT
jgi:hypothetical protein